ncbi:MAG: hypothetical protein KatS3mg030_417 [Saprospiraceae bacterium]|nr:MAG: hypothetical protein KatS3mg030_417 [Saprospiraceae bacterium]
MKKRTPSRFERNSLALGMVVALAVPLLSFGLLWLIFEGLETLQWVSDKGFRPMFRERTLAIISIGLNALLLNYYQKRYCTNTMRGIAIVTFFWVVLWLLLFAKYLF